MGGKSSGRDTRPDTATTTDFTGYGRGLLARPTGQSARRDRSRPAGMAGGQASPAAVLAAVSTSSTMAGVSLPVNVFCWLTW